jgi:hypothetical protein
MTAEKTAYVTCQFCGEPWTCCNECACHMPAEPEGGVSHG